MNRFLAAALALALPLLAAGPVRAEPSSLTQEEFKLWKEYKDALEDKRVQSMPEGKRLGAIAKNFKIPEKKLREAVDKGEKDGPAIGKQSEDAIKTALADTDFASRIKEIRVDTSAPHVITYVHWAADKTESIDKEACLAAVRTQKAAPVTGTISVWATDPKDDGKKLFEALISSEAAQKMKEGQIVDFASTRYLKLFEKVKRAE